MSQKFSKIIIGSGPTGLGAGYFLKENGHDDFIILEKENFCGGLATSFIDPQGFTWDIGGHVQFSHYSYFDKVMYQAIPKTEWLQHERSSWVWIYDRFVPYPFQNNIHRLPTEIKNECLLGLKNLTLNIKNAKNFEDWIYSSFGEGIAKHFMLPYNFKVWAYSPCKLNKEWVGERVAPIDISRIEENIKLNRDDISWGPNNTFQFPLEGGTGAIWKSVANLVGKEKIKLNVKINFIDTQKKIIDTDQGQYFYHDLLSTIPITELIKLCKIKTNSKEESLLFSSSHIVGIGIKGKINEQLKNKCWMYFPENNCPFYRVTVFSNYSPFNVPDASIYYSLMTETSSSQDKNIDINDLVNEVISGLLNTRLINKSDLKNIVSTWKYSAKYGYPTPSLARNSILQKIIPSLEQKNIYSRGRFGGWKYEVSNQDHTFMQGVEWADYILNKTQETTYKVN